MDQDDFIVVVEDSDVEFVEEESQQTPPSKAPLEKMETVDILPQNNQT